MAINFWTSLYNNCTKICFPSYRKNAIWGCLRIFGPETIGGWRKLHNEKLSNLYHVSSNLLGCWNQGGWIGGTCCICGTDKEYIQNFNWETWKEETILDGVITVLMIRLKQCIPGRTHKAYFLIALTSSPSCLESCIDNKNA
jgi:hypothetical protein